MSEIRDVTIGAWRSWHVEGDAKGNAVMVEDGRSENWSDDDWNEACRRYSDENRLAATSYMLGREHTCEKCEYSNIPCERVRQSDENREID